jgi:hypothetical protein
VNSKTDSRRYLPAMGPFLAGLRAAGIEDPVCEFRFCPSRKWQMDFAWPERKIALEVNGGLWSGGRHTRGSVLKDYEKLNAAHARGWRVFQCAPPPKGGRLPKRQGVHIPPYLTEPGLWGELTQALRGPA